MRLQGVLAFLMVAGLLHGCGKAKEDAEEEDVNEVVAAKFRSNWANKDLAIRSDAASEIFVCARLTALPGTCQFAKFDFGAEGTAYKGVFTDNCNIGILDAAVHIDLLCEVETAVNGCRDKEYADDFRTIDQTNSNKTLTGDETQITGLGDQDWRVGAGLCDAVFAAATKP